MYPLVELTIADDGTLVMAIAEGRRAELQELTAENTRGTWYWLQDAVEYQTCNGWTLFEADEIGALSNAPVLTQSATLEDNGEWTIDGPIWYYEAYQILDPIEQLLKHGQVIWDRAPADEEDEDTNR